MTSLVMSTSTFWLKYSLPGVSTVKLLLVSFCTKIWGWGACCYWDVTASGPGQKTELGNNTRDFYFILFFLSIFSKFPANNVVFIFYSCCDKLSQTECLKQHESFILHFVVYKYLMGLTGQSQGVERAVSLSGDSRGETLLSCSF